MRLYRDIKSEHTDERGAIIKILGGSPLKRTRSIVLITSKKGVTRGNHYHCTESHYIYVLWGEAKYYEKGLSKSAKLTEIDLKTGDMVYTEPMVIHTMKFLADSGILYMSTSTRNKKAYDKDTKYVVIV
jgi:quercetin dioxygenase-like cupin family protein